MNLNKANFAFGSYVETAEERLALIMISNCPDSSGETNGFTFSLSYIAETCYLSSEVEAQAMLDLFVNNEILDFVKSYKEPNGEVILCYQPSRQAAI